VQVNYFCAKIITLDIVKTYRTLKKESTGQYKEKGSKFIGIAIQCFNEEDAKEHLIRWKKEHHQARHFCYAYRFGLHKEQYRANDDGEPNNSAGAPILGQIQSFDLTNVLICVVRYYGGTKLGVGGLINAYRTGAKEAIENGKIITCTVHNWLKVDFEYADMPSIMKLVKDENLTIKEQLFELSCTLVLGVDLSSQSKIFADLDAFDTTEITDLGIY